MPLIALKLGGPFSRANLWRCLLLLLLGIAPTAHGQWVLSGNENKIDLTSGTARVLDGALPDTLSILDFSTMPPAVHHLVDLPNTVIGPPSNIAITPDGRLALVANSIRPDPRAPSGYVPENQIHLIDLQSNPCRRIGEIRVGGQPSGMSISHDGRQALVANRADGTVSVLALSGTQVQLLQTVEVGTPAESVSDVALHPDGRLALVSVQKGGYLAVLAREGDLFRATGRKVSVYGQPYRCVITPDGRFGLTAGMGMGNALDTDALTVVDLEAQPIRAVDYVALGAVPESIEVSPRGDLVAAVLMNGSNLPATDPLHSDHGTVVLVRRDDDRFVKVQELPVGRIPEGVAFTPDGRHLVVQCHPDRELWIYEVRRRRLRDTGLRIPVPGMPSSLRAAPLAIR